MKIFLLRHEKRNIRDPTFYSPLLPDGLKNAKKLKKSLKKNNINLIFSSPFKRVLQTIKPYCDQYNLMVNIDYSLYEQTCEHSDVDINFNKLNYKINLKKNDEEYYLVNRKYKSIIPLSDIKFTCLTSNRARYFFDYIVNKYKDTNYNILFASHEGILLQMLGLSYQYEIPMGGLLLCYDNGEHIIKKFNF